MFLLRYKKSIFHQLGLVLFFSGLFIVSFNNQGYAKIEPIKIGVILPLSGDNAFFGVVMRNALMLALEDINNQLKPDEPPVELIIEDDQGEANKSVAAFHKLTDVDKVKWVFSFGSWAVKPIVPLVQEKKIILIAQVTDPAIAKSSPYIFTIFLSDEAQAELMLDYIFKNDFRRIAILHTREPSHERTATEIIGPRIKEKGRSVIVESFSPKERDLTNHLLKLKEFDPELLVIYILPIRLNHIYEALQKSGMPAKVKILGNQGFALPAKAPDRIKEGVVFTALPPYIKMDEKISAYKERFERRFKERFDTTNACFIYDALFILYQCIKEGKGDIEKTRKALLAVKDYPGLIGKISIDSNGVAKVPIVLGVIRNGKNQFLNTFRDN